MSAVPITTSPEYVRYQLRGAEAECARLLKELRTAEKRLQDLTDFLERADGPDEPAMSVDAMLALEPQSSYARSIRHEIREAIEARRQDDAVDVFCLNCGGRRLDWVEKQTHRCQDCGAMTEIAS